MRIFLSTLLCLIGLNSVLSQAPSNDDCDDAIDLGTIPFCDTTQLFNNFEATASDIGDDNIPTCFRGASSESDVWFTFETTTAFAYEFIIQGVEDTSLMDSASIKAIEVAIYSGNCSRNGLTEEYCAIGTFNSESLSFRITALDDDTQYFLRINSANLAGVNNGNFYICSKEIKNELTLAEVGSDLCSGKVYDTGGPNGDYGDNEDYIFTICPDSAHACLTLNMGDYLMYTGDYFIIYEGPDTTGNIIGASFDHRDTTGKNTFEGINRAVCQMYFTQEKCMTIYWHTDSSNVSEGFVADWFCSADTCEVVDTISNQVNATQDQIISVLQGRLMTINSASANCFDTAYAIYDGDSTDVLLAEGLLLTTGRADSVARPNMVSDYGYKVDQPGIPLLDSLSYLYGDSTTTHDGCSVDLEFEPGTDVMALEFSLGSDEYPECTVRELNDIAALLYTTLGYNGNPRLNNYTNMATLPGNADVDLQIFTVTPNDSSTWVYYRNNLSSKSIEYDGMMANGSGGTKFVLLTQHVEPCQPNNLIAAIADRGDSLYDSGLFLSNIHCLTPSVGFRVSTGLNFFIEECNPGDDFVNFTFPRMYDEDTEWDVEFEGMAQEGSDFIWTHGPTITLPAGQSTLSLDIDVVNDMIDEGPETFKIKLSKNWGCGKVELTEAQISIRDRLLVEINGPTTVCKGQNINLSANPQDLELLNMSWEPAELFPNPRVNAVNFVADTSVQLVLTGTFRDFGCVWTDTIDIFVPDPQVEITTSDPTGICLGETVTLMSTDNVSGTGRKWSPSGTLSSEDAVRVVATPIRSGYYFVQVDTLGCPARDSIFITVDTLDQIVPIPDTTICLGTSINLTQSGSGSSRTVYNWTPNSTLDNPTSSNPEATPTRKTTYTVMMTSRNGHCEETDEVTVDVINVESIAISDQGILCPGDDMNLSEIAIPDSIKTKYNVTYSWSSDGGVSLEGGNGTETATFKVNDNGTVFLTVSVGGCTLMTSKFIDLDLFEADIMLNVDSTIAGCADVIATLVTNTNRIVPESIMWTFEIDNMNKDQIDLSDGAFTTDHKVNTSGKFIVTFMDDNGCEFMLTKEVEHDSPTFEVPNAFTPNGDNINDLFRVHFPDPNFTYEVKSIKVFNRWGKLVFDDNSNDGWDGKIDGEDAISEVYIYIIEMEDQCGLPVESTTESPLRGADVTLIR